MTNGVFYSLQGLLNDILSGDSSMSLDEFEERVQQHYNAGDLSGTQYDWLMGNID